MKLGFLHPTYEYFGGAEVLLSTQAQSMRRRGFDVCLVTRAVDRSRWAESLDGVPVRLIPARPILDDLTSPWPIGRLHREAERAARALADRDVVLAMNQPCHAELGASGLDALKVWYCNEPSRDHFLVESNPRLSARVEHGGKATTDAEKYFVRELEAHRNALRGRRRRWHEREFDLTSTRRLDRVIAISEFTRDNVRRIYGIEPAKVVYPIVRFPEPGRSRTGIDRERLGILVQSRLEFLKNVEVVIRGFARFQSQCPSAHLHIVGHGTEKRGLVKLIEELGLSAVTRFHGLVSAAELAAIYDVCDVFALLPLDEPFGMVFPEAAARGLLLVGPDHAGPFEILDGGKLGWLCDPFSSEAVAETFASIRSLSDTEADRRRSEARAACLSRFSEETIGPELAGALTR